MALSELVPALPESFGLPVIIVQHIKERSDNYLATRLDKSTKVNVKEADEKEAVLPGTTYLAPAGYHLFVEMDRTFSLSKDAPVSYSRPSVDVLFTSAVDVYGKNLIGIVLTGANSDGAQGLIDIKEAGGLTIVQNPESAESNQMPTSAIQACTVDHILELHEIAPLLATLDREQKLHASRTTTKKGL